MKYAKAVVGALLVGLAITRGFLPDGINLDEGLAIAAATLGSFATVWAIPNKDA